MRLRGISSAGVAYVCMLVSCIAYSHCHFVLFLVAYAEWREVVVRGGSEVGGAFR